MPKKLIIFTILLTLTGCQPKKKFIHIREVMVKAGDAELFVKTCGYGEPVVIIHGGPGFDHKHMLPFKKLAENEFKVIFYDQRGSGNSGGTIDPASINIDRFVEDLEAIRSTMNLGKINLIGHSFGGFLGMEYGIKYPENLESLILLAPAGASKEYLPRYFGNIERNTDPEDKEAMHKIAESEAFLNKDPAAFIEYWKIGLRPFFKDKSLIDKFNLDFGKNTAQNWNEIGRLMQENLGGYDIHAELSQINCPVLILHGTDDLLPIEGSFKIHKNIPGSKLIALENAGHFMFIDSPDTMFAIIEKFLIDNSSVGTMIPDDLEAILQ